MKRLVCLALIMLLLCGCAPAGSGTPETTLPATTAGPVLRAGYYIPAREELTSMYLFIHLAEDGTGSMSMLGSSLELTWAPDGGKMEDMDLTPTAEGLFAGEEDFRYCGSALPDDYTPAPPAPGVYAVSSVSRNGNVDFYGALTRDNGYLQIREDGTGLLVFDGTEYPFTLQGSTALFDGWSVMLLDMSDRDTGGPAMVTAYLFSGPVQAESIIFRLMEAAA